MKISGLTIKYIIAGLILTVLIGMYIFNYLGDDQEKGFIEIQTQFNDAIVLLQEGRMEEGLNLLNEVDKENNDSYLVKYYKGFALSNLNVPEKAIIDFDKLIDLNPYMTEEPMFMFIYGRALVQAGKTEEALIVLNKCKSLPTPEQIEDYQEQVNILIEQITLSS